MSKSPNSRQIMTADTHHHHQVTCKLTRHRTGHTPHTGDKRHGKHDTNVGHAPMAQSGSLQSGISAGATQPPQQSSGDPQAPWTDERPANRGRAATRPGKRQGAPRPAVSWCAHGKAGRGNLAGGRGRVAARCKSERRLAMRAVKCPPQATGTWRLTRETRQWKWRLETNPWHSRPLARATVPLPWQRVLCAHAGEGTHASRAMR